MHPNAEQLQRIEDKQDKLIAALAELNQAFAVHVVEDAQVKKDLAAVQKALPALQKTAFLAKSLASVLVLVLGSAGAWATGLIDVIKLLGKR